METSKELNSYEKAEIPEVYRLFLREMPPPVQNSNSQKVEFHTSLKMFNLCRRLFPEERRGAPSNSPQGGGKEKKKKLFEKFDAEKTIEHG